MTKAEYMEFHEAQCKRMIDITKKKNADYSGAGDDPFANFRQVGHLIQTIPQIVEIGMITRMSDKMSRIASFVEKGELQVKDESVQDTLLDVANYAILFMGILEEAKQTAGGKFFDRPERILSDAPSLNKCHKCESVLGSPRGFMDCRLADCPHN